MRCRYINKSCNCLLFAVSLSTYFMSNLSAHIIRNWEGEGGVLTKVKQAGHFLLYECVDEKT